jgi:aspartyl protease family protein
MIKISVTAFIILLNISPVCSDELKIDVAGLFSQKVVLNVNGTQRLLTVGMISPEGVKLISSSSHRAILEIEGKQKTYFLGSYIAAHYLPPPENPVVTLWPTNGMYLTQGAVNGYSVDFLVDTGASAIALNAKTAKRLGLEYINKPQINVKTASGITSAYSVQLDLVQVGEIKLHNIEAMIIDGEEPKRALLGMSFLGQLDMQRTDDKMDLKQKY